MGRGTEALSHPWSWCLAGSGVVSLPTWTRCVVSGRAGRVTSTACTCCSHDPVITTPALPSCSLQPRWQGLGVWAPPRGRAARTRPTQTHADPPDPPRPTQTHSDPLRPTRPTQTHPDPPDPLRPTRLIQTHPDPLRPTRPTPTSPSTHLSPPAEPQVSGGVCAEVVVPDKVGPRVPLHSPNLSACGISRTDSCMSD